MFWFRAYKIIDSYVIIGGCFSECSSKSYFNTSIKLPHLFMVKVKLEMLMRMLINLKARPETTKAKG